MASIHAVFKGKAVKMKLRKTDKCQNPMMVHLVIITSAAKHLKNSFGSLPYCKQLTQ